MSLSGREFKWVIWRHEAKLKFLESRWWRGLYAYEWEKEEDEEAFEERIKRKINKVKEELMKMLGYWDELEVLINQYRRAKNSWNQKLIILTNQEFERKLGEIEKYLLQVEKGFRHYNFIPGTVKEEGFWTSFKDQRPRSRPALEEAADKILLKEKRKPKWASLDNVEIK
mgnify:FL=1